MALNGLVDLSQPSLYVATAYILFNPLFWNIVARLEFKHKTLTRLAGGNALYGCYGLACTIFGLGILRDHMYKEALLKQPTLAIFGTLPYQALAAWSFAVGSVLVVSSMWALGVTGTYLGDYFGILMEEKVESFPFNVTANPMYWGSTLSFFGTAIWYQSPAGLLLTILVFIEYKIALTYEEPFTGAIYEAREVARAAAKVKARKSTGLAPFARTTALKD